MYYYVYTNHIKKFVTQMRKIYRCFKNRQNTGKENNAFALKFWFFIYTKQYTFAFSKIHWNYNNGIIV